MDIARLHTRGARGEPTPQSLAACFSTSAKGSASGPTPPNQWSRRSAGPLTQPLPLRLAAHRFQSASPAVGRAVHLFDYLEAVGGVSAPGHLAAGAWCLPFCIA